VVEDEQLRAPVSLARHVREDAAAHYFFREALYARLAAW
jgi:hypothetical protein